MNKRRRRERREVPAPEAATPSPLERFRIWSTGRRGRLALALAVALATLVLGLWTFDPKLSLSGDNTEFIVLARSLVDGQGLTYINDPNPQPATKYPFGFPLMLAPLEWLFPERWVPMKAMVLLVFALGMAAFYELVRPGLGAFAALAAVALCLTVGQSYLTTGPGGHEFGPLLLHYAHQEMSEAPYLSFSLLALLLFQRGAERPGLNRLLVAGFLCAMWAYYVRSAGVTLLAAMLAWLLLRREWQRAALMAGATFALWLPWALRNRAVGGGGVYFKQLLMVNPYYPEQGLLDAGGFVGRLLENARVYVGQDLPRLFWPWFEGAESVLHPVSLLLVALAVYAVLLSVRRRENLLLLLYAGTFMGVVFLWPWTGDRFVLPIVPVLLFFAVRVFVEVQERLAARGWREIGLVLVWGIFAAVLLGQAPGVGRLARYAEGDYPPAWSTYYQAGLWLRENAPPEAVILCRKGFWLYVVSGRRCVGFPFEEPEKVIAHMEEQGVDYVVVESLGYSQTPRFLVPAISQHQERFEVVWQRQDPPTWVLRFRRQ